MEQVAKLIIVDRKPLYLPKASFSSSNFNAPCPIFYDDFLTDYCYDYVANADDLQQVKLMVVNVRKPIIGEVIISYSGKFGVYKELEGYGVVQREINGRIMYYFYDESKHFPLIGHISPINTTLRDYLKIEKNTVKNMTDVLINLPTSKSFIKIVDLKKII